MRVQVFDKVLDGTACHVRMGIGDHRYGMRAACKG